MGKIKIKSWEKHIAGLIVAILAITTFNWDSISSVIVKEPRPLYIESCGAKNYHINAIETLLERHTGIPEYNAKLLVLPTKDSFSIGDNITFKFKFEDKGTLEIDDPYFYLLLYDPDNELRAAFPCFCNQNSIDLGLSPRCNYRSGETDCYFSSDYDSRFNKWNLVTEWINENDGKNWHCNIKKDMTCVNYNCYNKGIFFNENLIESPVVYSYSPDKTGSWKLYAFLFNNEYKTRKYGNTFGVANEFKYNSISSTKVEFIVEPTKEEEKRNSFGFILKQTIIIVLTFISYFFIILPYYDGIRKVATRNWKKIVYIILFILILFILTYNTCKLGCPVN